MFSASRNIYRLLSPYKETVGKLVCNEFWTSSKLHGERCCWAESIHEAEKIVGIPTSYLALKTLFSGEIPNISSQLKILLGTSHPLVSIGRKVIYEGKKNFQKRGLIVLLISKTVNGTLGKSTQKDNILTILQSQRSLAEITEMIYAAQLIHKGVVNVVDFCTEETKDLEFGNKMSILLGDYVLANACRNLAALRNPNVVEIISSSISDFTEAEFITINKYTVSTISEWKERNYLTAGSLLAKSCQAAALLAGHSLEVQNICFQFGKNIALSWQMYNDMMPFTEKYNPMTTNINLASAPIIYHNYFMESSLKSDQFIINSFNNEKIHNIIAEGPALMECKTIYNEYIDSALELTREFEPSDARRAIENMAKSQKIL